MSNLTYQTDFSSMDKEVRVTMPAYFGYLVVLVLVPGAFVVVVDESYPAVWQLVVLLQVVYTFPYVVAFDEPAI